MSSIPPGVQNSMNEMLTTVAPIITEFSGLCDGKIDRKKAMDLFYDFMQKTLPPQMRPTKELATSVVKSPVNGYSSIPQVMIAMVVLLQE
jgi:hypothetical protein